MPRTENWLEKQNVHFVNQNVNVGFHHPLVARGNSYRDRLWREKFGEAKF